MIFVVMGAIGYGASRVVGGERRPMTVATSGIELVAPAKWRVLVVPAPAEHGARAAMLRDGDAEAILARLGDGTFELLVAKDPRYLPELQALVAEHVRRERLATSGLSESELAGILSPPELRVHFTDPDRGRTGRAEKIAAGVFQGLVLLAIFTSMAYLLTGITGEKQLRVTESITAIIPPQAWIDGKILGICAYSLATIGNMVVGGLLLALVAKLAWGFSLPDVLVRPGVILVLIVYSILALLFWTAFFAAFASTIDDPNTSTRTSVMFLPMIPVGMTVSVLRDPDHLSARILAMFPVTSASAMPARLILSNPGVLEIVVSVGLLVATIWLVRRLAGRVFEIGMLLYGKEPTMSEILRWASAKSGRV
ncbi:MAG: ABC transporter permease [Gemmatimonadota bacterium]|nr:ABC transporter permease [Gemmatimonadota bacterium]